MFQYQDQMTQNFHILILNKKNFNPSTKKTTTAIRKVSSQRNKHEESWKKRRNIRIIRPTEQKTQKLKNTNMSLTLLFLLFKVVAATIVMGWKYPAQSVFVVIFLASKNMLEIDKCKPGKPQIKLKKLDIKHIKPT